MGPVLFFCGWNCLSKSKKIFFWWKKWTQNPEHLKIHQTVGLPVSRLDISAKQKQKQKKKLIKNAVIRVIEIQIWAVIHICKGIKIPDHHDFDDPINGIGAQSWFPVNHLHDDVVVTEHLCGGAGDLPHPQLIDAPGRCHREDVDSLISSFVCHQLNPRTWTPCHVAVRDDHGEEGGLRPWIMVLGHLVGHVSEGAVNVGAFAQVRDPAQAPDEGLSGCELAEDHLCLRKVQASDGPSDLDLTSVLLVCECLGEYSGVLLDALHQTARRGLLQGNGLWRVNGEEDLDGTVNEFW